MDISNKILRKLEEQLIYRGFHHAGLSITELSTNLKIPELTISDHVELLASIGYLARGFDKVSITIRGLNALTKEAM